MLNPKELRIGNYIQMMPEERMVKVVGIGSSIKVEFNHLSSYISSPEGFCPIELTPEIIKEFGFGYYGKITGDGEKELYHIGYHGDEYYFSVCFCVDVFESGLYEYISFYHNNNYPAKDNLIHCPPIKYLHQLQNLFFVLTGEEITRT